ncbi:CoA transferase (plasmid) [Cupriavidus sp. KK10]|jgi:alpha-methylacyl-CoA racemase|uniref:CaiB/BaiF CoA transferase family protein n=1 Tax=Cupriavidus sp. KK10 TaxID=1478019 RepID=UPI001BA4CEC1|nr:CaiB/BaiF CoA-transferase family protein [Cupriavidus sp. KK10]QUN32390.1 CoA transferase [Cupriavidus sp. KK10]
MSGPLKDVRIIEFGAIGPAPFACMMLADNGADVIRVARHVPAWRQGIMDASKDVLARSRRVVHLDLKTPDGVREARALARSADGIVEGYRPGVMEKLGLGPEVLLADNPRLVYGRMTGWGQEGPLAQRAGHDINYIALAGALHAFGREGGKPTPPANLVADFGGGGMLLAFGMVSAILHARTSGEGQVVDCAMVDGTALLMGMMWSLRSAGVWRDERGVNLLDTGAHFYETYETSDGKHVAIGAVEPEFYALLRERLGLVDDPDFDCQRDPKAWPGLKAKLAKIFKSRSRDEWCRIFDDSDACVTPVLSMSEAPNHPHARARGVFATIDGVIQPSPAPRYSRTVNDAPRMLRPQQDDRDAVIASLAPLHAESDSSLTNKG